MSLEDKIKTYRRIFRICPKMYKNVLKNVPKVCLDNIADPPKRKRCLSQEDIKNLLDGHVTIEEKIDGGVVGLAWDGDKKVHLAIGKHSIIDYNDNSKKFYGLNNWIYSNYEKIARIPKNFVVYGEWMKASHNIFYDQLEDFFYAFDVWDGYKYLNWESRSIFLCEIGFKEIPVIYSGNNLGVGDILCICEGKFGVNNRSRFSSSEIFEGVVVRNDNGLIGKYVRREFLSSIKQNWLNLPLIENRLGEKKR